MKHAALLWLLLFATIGHAQEEVPILDFSVSEAGTPQVTITTSPEFYYVLFGPQGRARTLVQGTGEQAVLTEALAARPAGDYTVRRYPMDTPADLDADSVDDLTELSNIPGSSPFNPTLPINLHDGAAMIPDRITFDSLAFHSEVPANNTPLDERDLVKFYITDNDADSMRLYFMNTNTHEAHVGFATTFGIPVQANGNSFFEDMRGLLVYHPEVMAPNGTMGVYTFQFQPFDQYPFEIIEKVFEALGANLPFLANNLAYLPLHQRAVDVYNENRDRYDNSRIPVLLEGDLYEAIDYLALHVAEGYGRLRLMMPGERPDTRDIVVYETVPNDLPRVGGIITTVIQTPLSHVNLRALQDNVPNAFIRNALNDANFTDLLGEYVYFKASLDAFELRAASAEEIDNWYDALRPDDITVPDRDLSIQDITPLDAISFDQATAFGAKTANLATMRDFGFREHTIPDGFGIPLFFYDEFMHHNDFYSRVQSMLDNEEFQNDYTLQEEMLEAFRSDIEAGDIPAWMMEAFSTLQDAFPAGTNIRCRSSTNNEDLPGFSGAGLYESKTHKTDEGHIAKTIKEVFAGLWTFRAFAERSFFRIDHLQVGMGVLCHPNFKEERVNGVGITLDPIYGTENNYYLNAQIGEDLVTNPNAFSLPEEILLQQTGSGEAGYEIRRRSNLVLPGQQVLNVNYLDTLRGLMDTIHAEFTELYGINDNPAFGMDIEFKIDSTDRLVIKQARPWVGYLEQLNTSTTQLTSSSVQLEVYPNPVAANTRLFLDLPASGMVQLVLFDAQGRPVSKLLDRRLPAGATTLPLATTGLKAGVYFLRARVASPDKVEYASLKLVR